MKVFIFFLDLPKNKSTRWLAASTELKKMRSTPIKTIFQVVSRQMRPTTKYWHLRLNTKKKRNDLSWK